MIVIEPSLLNIILLLPVAHFLNTFLMHWLPHFLLHQKILGIPLYKIHFYSHHGSGASPLWAWAENSFWAGIVLLELLVYRLCLSPWLFWLFVGEGFSLVSLYWMHVEFDNPHSKLSQYQWFRDARNLHRFHHSYSQEAEFTTSKNYSVGGFGLHTHLIDRLMGTFHPLEQTNPKLRGLGTSK